MLPTRAALPGTPRNLVILTHLLYYSTAVTDNLNFIVTTGSTASRSRYYMAVAPDLGDNVLVPTPNAGTASYDYPNIRLKILVGD